MTLDLTYNFIPFQAVLFESGTQLSPIHQIAHLLYLKIWLRPHLSMVTSLNLDSDKKTPQILPTSIGFSALANKWYGAQIFTPDCGEGFAINLLNILEKYGSIYSCNFLTVQGFLQMDEERKEQMHSDWF